MSEPNFEQIAESLFINGWGPIARTAKVLKEVFELGIIKGRILDQIERTLKNADS